MNFNDREKIIELMPLWKGERLPDGRPKVEDKYLDALYGMTLEEVWKPIFVLGYEHQFVGGGLAPLATLHDDGRKLVGRAVTCTYCPTRPDLHDVQFGRGAEDGLQGNYNQWVIDRLYERDVVVCDMYDKIYKGTFLGGNLTTALQKHTKTGGAVIWGGVLNVGDSIKIGDFEITAVFADHTVEAFGLIVKVENITLYFSGDTLYNENLFEIADFKLDITFICINGRLGNMNVDEALITANKMGAKINIPNHYDMFESNSENPLLFSEKIKGGFVMEFNKEYTVREKDDRIFI